MADIKISELGAASAVNATDLFPVTSNGVTVKVTAQQLKNFMGVGNLSDLHTTDKSSHVNAINEVDEHADNAQASANVVQAQVSNSGDAYSSSKAYAVGDLCIYNNVLYRCTTACSAGSWATNQSCFTADTLTRAVNELPLVQLRTYTVTTLPTIAAQGTHDIQIGIDLISGYNLFAAFNGKVFGSSTGCYITRSYKLNSNTISVEIRNPGNIADQPTTLIIDTIYTRITN